MLGSGVTWAETRAAPSLRSRARGQGWRSGSGAARGGPGPDGLRLRPRRPRLLLPFLPRRLTLSQQRGGRRRRRRSGSEAPGPHGGPGGGDGGSAAGGRLGRGGGRRPCSPPAPAAEGHEQRPDRERLAGAGERGEAEAPARRDGPGRAATSPGPAPPGGRARAGTRGGRAPGGRGALSPRDPPGAPFLPHFPVYPGATFFHAIWCQPLGRGLSSGRARPWIGEREARGSGRRRRVPPAWLVATVSEPSDWTPSAEAERWCQGGNPGGMICCGGLGGGEPGPREPSFVHLFN